MNLNELRILNTAQGEILVPNYFGKETNDLISAAILSPILGTSVNTILKQIPKEIPENKEPGLTDQVINDIQTKLKEIYKRHSEIKYTEEYIRTFGVHTSLFRLKHSYEVCIFLINLGFYFEANTIIRLIFEQLVFSTNIADVTNEEYPKLKSSDIQLSPTKIGKLEKIVSDLKIGKFYGDLSNRAHINISEVGKYITYDDKIKQVMVTERSKNLTYVSAILLLTVCYIHQIVLEYSFKEFITDFKYLEKIDDIYKSIPDMDFRNKIHNYHKSV